MSNDKIKRKVSTRRAVPEGGMRKTRKHFRWGRAVIFLVMIAILGTLLFKGSAWVYDTFINPPVNRISTTEGSSEEMKGEVLTSRINILLLGIDDGDSEAAATEPKRSDAMMVLSVDPEKNSASVLSLPRDTMVVLPGHKGFDKINAAYAYGGTVMAKQTVQNLLRIPIHYYVVANWRGFIDIVDQIGGVTISVAEDMYYEDPYADLVIDIKKGPQHMNGETAGKYVRFRNDELGDIGRVQRQQQFMKAAAQQMFSLQNLSNIGGLMATLDKYVSTDLNAAVMLKAANSFKLFGDNKIKSCMLYGQFADTMGGSYWATTRADINKSLDELGIPHMSAPKEESPALSGNFKSDEEGVDKLQKKLQKVKPAKAEKKAKQEKDKSGKRPVISNVPVKSEEAKDEAKEEEVKVTTSKNILTEEAEEPASKEDSKESEAAQADESKEPASKESETTQADEPKEPASRIEAAQAEEAKAEEPKPKDEPQQPAPERKVPTISNEPIRRKG